MRGKVLGKVVVKGGDLLSGVHSQGNMRKKISGKAFLNGGRGGYFFLSGVHSRGNMKGKVSGKVFLNE